MVATVPPVVLSPSKCAPIHTTRSIDWTLSGVDFVCSGTRYDVDLREIEVEELSLTQQLAREAGIEPERDRPARSRDR